MVSDTAEPPAAEDPVPMMTRRREFVSREIERAGMELIAERGYDDVTIAEIAAAAGVSRRTFFRHFDSKSSMTDAFADRLIRRVVAALMHRPADEPAAGALASALIATAEMSDDEQALARLRHRALQQVRGDPTTIGSPEAVEDLVDLVATRMHVHQLTDLRPRLTVWTMLAAAQAATKTWVELDDDSRLVAHVDAALEIVLGGLRDAVAS